MKLWICVLILAGNLSAAVWSTNKVWSESNEKAYSAWVESNWTNDVFTNSESPLFGLKTDCADASYAMRAYYAFLNGLPVNFHRYDGAKIDQTMSSFDHIKDPFARFRSYLNYVFDVTDTRTLSRDTYAIDINRQKMRAGIVYVSPGIHSYQITGLDIYGVPQTLSSTVPREQRLLFSHYGFPFYVPQDTKKYLDGFRAFKTDAQEESSKEQFQIAASAAGDFISYQEKMIQKLQIQSEPFDRRITRIKGNLCFFSRERAVLVTDAFVAQQTQGGSCFGYAAFDGYSTYIRDEKLKKYFMELKKMTSSSAWASAPHDAKKTLLSVFLIEIPDNDCTVETSLPIKPTLRLAEIYQALEAKKIVSDPNATMAQRWGLESYKPKCPVY
ncbi:MAG: hypothetical protein JNM24_11250 [Bdellovibrionaceae bacterium]|nr:hypothetical protein [Pseudobdellovibrionaceae bacterium]